MFVVSIHHIRRVGQVDRVLTLGYGSPLFRREGTHTLGFPCKVYEGPGLLAHGPTGNDRCLRISCWSYSRVRIYGTRGYIADMVSLCIGDKARLVDTCVHRAYQLAAIFEGRPTSDTHINKVRVGQGKLFQ